MTKNKPVKGRSQKYVNRLKKLYRHADFLLKFTKLPLIKGKLERDTKNDKLIYLTQDSVIAVNQEVEREEDMILPSKVVEYFINKANDHWIMNFCICRDSNNCQNYPQDYGCLFMGKGVHDINPEFGRLVSKEEALEYVKKCREAGLVHTVGRNKLDAIWLKVEEEEKLLTVCNCCECCCISKFVAKLGPKISKAAVKMPGVRMVVSDDCKGCGLCEKVCIFNAIEINDKKANINDLLCRACGRCANACPTNVIQTVIEDDQFINEAIAQIDELVDIS